MRWNSNRRSHFTPDRGTTLVGVVAGVLAIGAQAQADWRAYLLPASNGATEVAATGAGNGFFAGYQFIQGGSRATLWSGPQSAPSDLHPAGYSHSLASAIWQNTQVGTAYYRDANGQTVNDAVLWHGTADSVVTLSTSPTYWGSTARSIRVGQIAGTVGHVQTGLPHAALWTGPTFSTFVDLHNNTKAEYSESYATDGQSQGGWAVFRRTGQIHAALWHGTSASMTDVNPSWSRESWILGMAPGAQVGRAAPLTASYQPVLWHGSADSAIIMTPSAFGGGELTATDGVRHVGLASIGSTGYAGIWMSDDPNSFVNLAALVGNNVAGSSANAIYSDANNIYVAGQIRLGNGPLQGVVWVQEVPAPGAAALIVMGVVVMGRRRR